MWSFSVELSHCLFRYVFLRAVVLVMFEQAIMQFQFLIHVLDGRESLGGFKVFHGMILLMLASNMVIGVLMLLLATFLTVACSWALLADVILIGLGCVCQAIGFVLVKLVLFDSCTANPLVAWITLPVLYSRVVLLDAWLPWLTVLLLGIVIARNGVAQRHLALCAAICGSLFLVFRWFFVLGLFNFGNFRPVSSLSGFVFFSMSKYPPSFVFLSCWTCCCLVLLLAFQAMPVLWFDYSPFAQLVVLGRAPLFFYGFHLAIFVVITAPFAARVSVPLFVVYIVWIVGVAVCYFPTCLFGQFKQRTSPDSLWRLF
jgi:hypothetical protein